MIIKNKRILWHVMVYKFDSPVEFIPKSHPNWLFKGQVRRFDLQLLNYFYGNIFLPFGTRR